MRPATLTPALHVLVCVNRRAPDDPLGGGCGVRGEVIYETLKSEVAAIGETRRIWVTRTYCLGVCPKGGATVAAHDASELRVFTETEPGDAAALLSLLDAPPKAREI